MDKMRISATAITALLLTLALTATGRGADSTIWVEGEAATSNTMKPHNWYSSMVKQDELSGGAYLTHFAPGTPPVADYSFEAATAGEYEFWARMNPVAGPAAEYNLNHAGWKEIGFKGAQDVRNIAADAKPDMRFLGWLNLGKVTLKSGRNALQFRFSSKNNNFGSLDCFLFTKDVFTPNGKLRPGQRLRLAEPGMWAFEPDADTFSKGAMLDLSYLNTPIKAGDPFITVNGNGDFAKGGKTLPFWAVNSYVQNEADMDTLRRHARWLAKRGVNLVRWHGHLPTDEDPKPTRVEDVNRVELDRCFKLVAAMKESGIYSCVSPYWGSHTRNKPSWGLKHIESDNLSAVVFWDKQVQAAYKNYLKELFTAKNPYTGIALKDDPALAIIQLQNEDSMLFWTMQAVKGKVVEDLERLFADFAVKKYGSLDKAYAAWDGNKQKNDDPADGRLGLNSIWELTQIQDAGREKRKSDQFAFFCEVMRKFNTDMEKYLHEDLGCRQVVNPGNWRTANEPMMLDGERYSYAGSAVIGANRYKSVAHNGPRNGYLIAPGDTYSRSSVLRNPLELPVAVKQVAGRAMIIPESNWVPPEKYQAEGPLLVAAYSALNGVDALIWFCDGKPEWEMPFGKWSIATPAQAGQFPAAALMFRAGYLERGKPVLHEERPLTDLWQRKVPLLSEGQVFDPNRDSAADAAKSGTTGGTLHPLAFLVGPVEAVYGGDPAKTTRTDLKPYINEAKKTVASATGQLALDYGRGIFTINAPCAQAAAGWLSLEKEIKLADLSIISRNEYSAISAVSLDGKPLKSSGNVLIQIGTFIRPYGFREEPTKIARKGLPPLDGFTITSLGQSIWNVGKADAQITLKNPKLTMAVVLDANGMPVKKFNLEKQGDGVALQLPEDALYVILK